MKTDTVTEYLSEQARLREDDPAAAAELKALQDKLSAAIDEAEKVGGMSEDDELAFLEAQVDLCNHRYLTAALPDGNVSYLAAELTECAKNPRRSTALRFRAVAKLCALSIEVQDGKAAKLAATLEQLQFFLGWHESRRKERADA